MEKIKQFRNFEYWVDIDGNIFNNKNKQLHPYRQSAGYQQINLYKNGKKYKHLLHRIVMELFDENFDEKKQVNHKDLNKNNNNFDNLEMVTCKENVQHYYLQLKKNKFFTKILFLYIIIKK